VNKVKVTEPHGPLVGTDLRFLSPQPDTILHCKTTDMGLVYCVVYSPAFAGTQCAHPRSDGQAELTGATGNNGMVYLPTDGSSIHALDLVTQRHTASVIQLQVQV